MENKDLLIKMVGESAFPVKMDMGDGSRIEGMGMSLRDYLAAKAMQAWVSQIPPEMMEDMMIRWAENSYEMADAMLRARGK